MEVCTAKYLNSYLNYIVVMSLWPACIQLCVKYIRYTLKLYYGLHKTSKQNINLSHLVNDV